MFRSIDQAEARRCLGFTVVDLLVCLAVVFGLLYLLTPYRSGPKVKAARINCVSNLKQVGLAFHMWADSREKQFPMMLSATSGYGGTLEHNLTGETWKHFQILSNELSTPKVLRCTTDTRDRVTDWSAFSGNQHLSYFVGLDADETKPQTILSGDRNIIAGVESATAVLTLRNGDRPVWTKAMHNRAGNVALADGSAHQLTDSMLVRQFQAAFTNSGRPVLRLALPK